MGFGLVIGYVKHLQIVTTSNFSAIANSHALQFTTARTKSPQTAVSSPVVAWWRLSTADIPLPLGSQTVPVPQLSASHSHSSQRLNCSKQLTSFHCTPLHSLTQLGWSNDIALERICKKTQLPTMLVARVPLPSNGSSGDPYLRSCCLAMVVVTFVSRSLPSNGSMWHIAPSLRLFVPNSLQVYHHFFFSEGCVCDVCDRSCLPSLWLGSCMIALQLLPPACLEQFRDKMWAGPGVPPPSIPVSSGKTSKSGRSSYISGS
jgi:hypothetical protein